MSKIMSKLAEAYAEVNENQKAALAKKLAKAAASSEKGKKAVTLSKPPFQIPEDVPVDERDMFMAKAAAAHKAGKTHFTMPGGKKHPVTMKKDTAQAVNSSTNEMSSKEKMKRGLYNGSKDDEEVVMNPKKEKKEKSTETDNMAQESVIPPVYARILEARATADADGKHKGKGADPESWDEKEKNNKGAMDMKADHKGETIDNPEAGDQMTKAANAAPKAPARKGDNAAGDKKIIPSATPTKGM